MEIIKKETEVKWGREKRGENNSFPCFGSLLECIAITQVCTFILCI